MIRVRTARDQLAYFEAGHLNDELRAISEPFGRLATQLVDSLPDSYELLKSVDLLLSAKDAGVRAALDVIADRFPATNGVGPVPRSDDDAIVLPANTPQPG